MIDDVEKNLGLAKLSLADAEANIAEVGAVKADTASDPANQQAEDAEAAAIRDAKVATAKAALRQAVAHLSDALNADWSSALPDSTKPLPVAEPTPAEPPALPVAEPTTPPEPAPQTEPPAQ